VTILDKICLDKVWTRVRNVWPAPARRNPAVPDVIIHDPAATAPQDLDDPFLDPTAQARAAELISKGQRKKS
jgi:hypothetical protein